MMQRLRRLLYVTDSCFSHIRHIYHKEGHILKLHERGLLTDIYPKHDTAVQDVFTQPQTVYCGYDLTADGLHIGHLLSLNLLLHCQKAGHQPLCVLGGATTLVGDPSGKSRERPLLSQDEVDLNLKGITHDIKQIFQNFKLHIAESDTLELKDPIFLNNIDWYNDMSVLEFLTNIGRNVRIGPMLARESVKRRMENEVGLSLTEFLYQVFQAHDFYHLHQRFGCMLQVGGHDQMGNISAGHDLVKRLTGKTVYGLTVPLVTSQAGAKIGKSFGSAIWLNKNKTSPFYLYQYFLRTPDSEVEKYLYLFTFLPKHQIKSLVDRQKEHPISWRLQKVLAEQVTTLVHGKSGVESAKLCSHALYQNNIEALSKVSADDLTSSLPGASVTQLLLEPGITVSELAVKTKCLDSFDVERIIKAGGFYINHVRQTNPDQVLIMNEHILPNKISLLRVGKRNYYLVKWLGC